MTRLALALAAVLVAGSPLCAQQLRSSPSPLKQQKGRAMPIPAWNIHGHAEEIPNLTVHVIVTGTSQSLFISPSNCLIVAKNGRKYKYVEAFGHSKEQLKKHFSKKDLKKFRSSGTSVQILPAQYDQSDLQSALDACFQ